MQDVVWGNLLDLGGPGPWSPGPCNMEGKPAGQKINIGIKQESKRDAQVTCKIEQL